MRLTLSPDTAKEDKGSIPSLRPDGLRGTASTVCDAAKTPPRERTLHWSDREWLCIAGLIAMDRRDLARKFLSWSQKQIDKQARIKPAPSRWRGHV